MLRLWMGQIAGQQERTADAEATFASLEQSTPLGWYGLLLQARAYRDAGDDDAEANAYRRFLDLWSAAAPDHPYVVEAREAVG